MFISLLGCFGFYFVTVLPANAVDVMPYQMAFFVFAVVVLVIMQIVGHIVIAIVGSAYGDG